MAERALFVKMLSQNRVTFAIQIVSNAKTTLHEKRMRCQEIFYSV